MATHTHTHAHTLLALTPAVIVYGVAKQHDLAATCAMLCFVCKTQRGCYVGAHAFVDVYISVNYLDAEELGCKG